MMYDFDQYVSGSLGYAMQHDSDNAGAFTRDFTTGNIGGALGGATLPAGADVGWTTEFEGGLFAAAAYGWRFDNGFRVEAEVSYDQNDVDTHDGVTAGGIALDDVDAAVLITGADPLGVTVGDLVADGQGDISNFAVAVNAYYDFRMPDSPFSIYGGAGVGVMESDIEFAPSSTGIVEDTETGGFFQLMVGGAYAVSETTEFYAGYRYRQSEDLEVDSSLIPATLEIENKDSIIEAGVRFTF
jgi:opacity protein-like surface antigen